MTAAGNVDGNGRSYQLLGRERVLKRVGKYGNNGNWADDPYVQQTRSTIDALVADLHRGTAAAEAAGLDDELVRFFGDPGE